MVRSLLLLVVVCPALVAAEPPITSSDSATFQKLVQPFFQTYCGECHYGDTPKGDLNLEAKALSAQFGDATTKARWKEVVNVLNSHSMPPKKAKQPSAKETAAVVDWITQETIAAELANRESRVVLRRLNRAEYQNTIRDLIGIDYDVSAFPEDPAAGGFDNNGTALTVSPLHIEIYLNAAMDILDRALVEGDQPKMIRWRFNPKAGPADRTRVRLDPKNNALVNGNANKNEGDWVVVHHESWNTDVGARDFSVPVAGNYRIRAKVAGRVPNRQAVVESAKGFLAHRRAEQDAKNPKGARWTNEQYERDLLHFQTDRMYNYGPPRVKLNLYLGPQPKTIAEFDVEGTAEKPQTLEWTQRFNTEKVAISFEYAYNIPRELENFWMQGHENFARPEWMIDWFEVEGPIYETWPPASHTHLLPDSPLRTTNEEQYAEQVIQQFLRRAYRRPVTAEEVQGKYRLYQQAKADGATFLEAIKRPFAAILISPHFLFLAEPAGEKPTQPRPLTDHELATRMSYFLWSSPPDAELTALATAGKLTDAKVRRDQVQRMLKDPKSAAFVRNFAGQWLGLREVGNNPPAMDLYRRYDRHLETSMVTESEEFFREILQNNLDVRNFLKSDFVTINERLARFYGIPGVKGDHFRKVPVTPNRHRGGLVTQASMLTITSNGTRTSPVKRGTWIMKTLLGMDPGLPVANAGEIAPKVPGIDKATVRKRLEIHRQLDQCARCHNRIDPLGLSLENFNAAGEWREREGFGYQGRISDNDPKIDASAEMIDGTQFIGVAGLQEQLLRQEDAFLRCLSEKVLTYALGRELGLADRPTITAAVQDLKNRHYQLAALIEFAVSNELFQTK